DFRDQRAGHSGAQSKQEIARKQKGKCGRRGYRYGLGQQHRGGAPGTRCTASAQSRKLQGRRRLCRARGQSSPAECGFLVPARIFSSPGREVLHLGRRVQPWLSPAPSSIQGLSGLAQTYARMGQNDKAKELVQKVLAANPKSGD